MQVLDAAITSNAAVAAADNANVAADKRHSLPVLTPNLLFIVFLLRFTIAVSPFFLQRIFSNVYEC